MTRKDFEMTDEDLATLMNASKTVPLIAIHCGTARSRQERVNAAWKALGEKMNFDHMTVQPIQPKGDRFFTAEAVGDA